MVPGDRGFPEVLALRKGRSFVGAGSGSGGVSAGGEFSPLDLAIAAAKGKGGSGPALPPPPSDTGASGSGATRLANTLSEQDQGGANDAASALRFAQQQGDNVIISKELYEKMLAKQEQQKSGSSEEPHWAQPGNEHLYQDRHQQQRSLGDGEEKGGKGKGTGRVTWREPVVSSELPAQDHRVGSGGPKKHKPVKEEREEHDDDDDDSDDELFGADSEPPARSTAKKSKKGANRNSSIPTPNSGGGRRATLPNTATLTAVHLNVIKNLFSLNVPRKMSFDEEGAVELVLGADPSIAHLKKVVTDCELSVDVRRGCNKRDVVVEIIRAVKPGA